MSKLKPIQHWSTDVSDCDIAELSDISDKINAGLIRAAGEFIEIGNALNRARVLIPGDLEFGQWRDQHTPFTARQANNYMKVARKFSTHSLVAKTSLSVLVELSSAPQELTEQVEREIDAGTPPTRAEVQERKRQIKKEEERAKVESQDADNLPPVVDPPPPEDEDTLPEGDYEMIAVTEDEFDLVIAALEFYAADGNDDAMALAERLNQ